MRRSPWPRGRSTRFGRRCATGGISSLDGGDRQTANPLNPPSPLHICFRKGKAVPPQDSEGHGCPPANGAGQEVGLGPLYKTYVDAQRDRIH